MTEIYTTGPATFDTVFGIEPRGFILGSNIAHLHGKGFVPIRRKGKLPAEKVVISAIGPDARSAEFEVHLDALIPGQTVLLVDGNPHEDLRTPIVADALRARGLNVVLARG